MAEEIREKRPEDLISLQEAADMLSLSRTYLYHIYKDSFKYYVFGKAIRVSRRAVLRWAEKFAYDPIDIKRQASEYCKAHPV